MQAYRLALVSAAATMILSATALAQPAAPPSASPSSQSLQARPHVRGARGQRMPRELRIMWKQELRPQLKAIPRGQRHAWLRQQWQSMSPEQQQAKLAELQAKWDALPEPARQAALQKMQNRAEMHRAKDAMSEQPALPGH